MYVTGHPLDTLLQTPVGNNSSLIDFSRPYGTNSILTSVQSHIGSFFGGTRFVIQAVVFESQGTPAINNAMVHYVFI